MEFWVPCEAYRDSRGASQQAENQWSVTYLKKKKKKKRWDVIRVQGPEISFSQNIFLQSSWESWIICFFLYVIEKFLERKNLSPLPHQSFHPSLQPGFRSHSFTMALPFRIGTPVENYEVFFFLIEIYLIYNIALVSGVQHSDSDFSLQIIVHHRLLWDVEYNSLCYTSKSFLLIYFMTL